MLPGSTATELSLATYVPIHDMAGATIAAPVRGAFVIEQDLSAILTQLRAEQFRTATLVVGMMSLQLVALLFAIRWAGSVLQTQHTMIPQGSYGALAPVDELRARRMTTSDSSAVMLHRLSCESPHCIL